jgi:hypothetical protein
MANTATNLENIWTKIAAVTRDEVILAVLRDEVEVHKSRLRPFDTGHIYTIISGIEDRIKEIQK